MKKILLLAVVCGLLWTGYQGIHLFSQSLLITDYYQTQSTPKPWGLVNFEGQSPVIYGFDSVSGLTDLLLTLWPLWGFALLLICGLLPLTGLIYNQYHNAQILAAQEAQATATEQANNRIRQAEAEKEKIRQWAENQVESAYSIQLSRVRQELGEQSDNLDAQQKKLCEWEESLRQLENQVRERQTETEQEISAIRQEYAQELQRFEEEIQTLTKAKENALSGYKRLKKRHERLTE
ncbi:hypothetical protein [Vibrio aerogenes]|uniref:hypothetical protein n=1 Tax=Vibrio aerogenes TaxID=92172 RepID=UPI0039F13040